MSNADTDKDADQGTDQETYLDAEGVEQDAKVAQVRRVAEPYGDAELAELKRELHEVRTRLFDRHMQLLCEHVEELDELVELGETLAAADIDRLLLRYTFWPDDLDVELVAVVAGDTTRVMSVDDNRQLLNSAFGERAQQWGRVMRAASGAGRWILERNIDEYEALIEVDVAGASYRPVSDIV